MCENPFALLESEVSGGSSPCVCGLLRCFGVLKLLLKSQHFFPLWVICPWALSPLVPW